MLVKSKNSENKGVLGKRVRVTTAEKVSKLKRVIEDGKEEFHKTHAEYFTKVDEEEELRKQMASLKTKLKRVTKSKKSLYAKMLKWHSIRRVNGVITREYGKKFDLEDKLNIIEMKDSIQKSNQEFAFIAKENKKRASKTILSEISKLPEEIVDHIQGFIPFEIRNEILEYTYHPLRKLIPKLDTTALSAVIKKIYLEPSFFASLDSKRVEENTHGTLSYKPEWRPDTKTNAMVRLMNVIVEMKYHHPDLLYKLLKTISILIHPDKTYKGIYILSD
jgi:hypothetical protein